MGSTPRGISASRGASVLGLGEYEGQSVFTAWQLLEEELHPGFNARRGYLLPEPPDNAAIHFGHAFEDAVCELASAKQGKQIVGREQSYTLAVWPNLAENWPDVTCHIDGRYIPIGVHTDHAMAISPQTLHEGKTTSLFNFWESWGTPGTDRIPQGYQIQVQHQMLCTGASEAIVSVLVFPRRPDEWEKEGWKVVPFEWDPHEGYTIPRTCYRLENEKLQRGPKYWARVIAEMGLFHQYPVAASPSLQRTLVDAYSHFWHRFVLPEREPEIDAYKDLQRAFPAPVGTIVLTEDEERWISERKLITEEIGDSGRLGKRKEELKVLTLKSICARLKQDAVIDNESTEKVIFRNAKGEKLGSWDSKTLR